MNDEIEKELLKFGEVEKVSSIFKLYLVNTTRKNKENILKINGVISVKDDEVAELMPLSYNV
jgi:hypothetical protein